MPVTPAMIWKVGAGFTTTGILAGAFGAHALAQRLAQNGKASSWHTASNYMIFNGVALLALSQHPQFLKFKWASPLIMVGTGLFSTSIFLLVVDNGQLGNFRKVLGPVTPIGGMAMIIGYLSLML